MCEEVEVRTLFISAVALMVACNDGSNNGNASTGGGSSGIGGGFGGNGGLGGAGGGNANDVDAGGPELTCLAILQCSNACNSADTDCIVECLARGSAAAKAQLEALVACDETNACNGNDTCLSTSCAAEVGACVGGNGGSGGGSGGGMSNGGGSGTSGGGMGGGGASGGGSFDAGSGGNVDAGSGDGFPARFTGTVVDENPNFAGTQLKSTGDAVFVRDDSADPRGTSGMFAFYKLQSVTYVATQMGMDLSGCTFSANETATFMSPPPLGNLVAIMKQPDGQGRYQYDVTTTLSTRRPNSLTIACPPPGGTSTADWNAELNVAAGVPAPTTTDRFKLKANVTLGGRNWSWDLTGSN